MKKMNSKNLKFSVNNTVVIAFAIVVVLLLNVIAVLLESRVPNFKVDLTENAITKIGKETKELLASIDETDIKINLIYLKGTGDVDVQAKSVLEQYDAYCDNITYKAMNYHTNPAFLTSFGINSDINVDGSILVAREDKSKARMVNANDMAISYNSNTVYLLENLLTNAIGVVASDKQMNVCFSTGHGEIVEVVQKNPVSQSEEQGGLMLINLLKSENISAYQYDISTGEIPRDIDIIMIMSPQEDFTQEEINRLDNYMLSGGNAIVSLSSGVVLPRLEKYMKSWGIGVNNDIVTENDPSARFDESGVYFYPKAGEHKAMAGVDRILASYAKSLTFTPVGDIEADVIIKTSENAVSIPVSESGVDVSHAVNGEFNLGYILEKPLDGSFENTSKLVVTGTEAVWGITKYLVTQYDMMVYYSLSEQSMGNNDFVMNMLGEIFGEDIQNIYVPIKSRQVSVLTMSEAESNTMRTVLCFVIPIAVLLCGIIVWLKRRNK